MLSMYFVTREVERPEQDGTDEAIGRRPRPVSRYRRVLGRPDRSEARRRNRPTSIVVPASAPCTTTAAVRDAQPLGRRLRAGCSPPLGFEALATTSAGFAWALGKLDQQVTRDELVDARRRPGGPRPTSR